ncbi:hypothetical protein J5690_09340 [bacterium]|nr:hypothetical protein [bacterium]
MKLVLVVVSAAFLTLPFFGDISGSHSSQLSPLVADAYDPPPSPPGNPDPPPPPPPDPFKKA